ncbi:MAG: NAD(P)/FAD-dependent oxidoreductase [bacterium]
MIPIAVVGAGPAGMAAAIQLKRLGHEPAVYERRRVGGLLVNAYLVENYPGFPDGIPGRELVKLMEAQVAAHSICVRFEEVLRVEASQDCFVIRTSHGVVKSRALLVASGTRPRTLDFPAIPAGLGGRILTEVYSIRGARGKRVAIVGAGDAAFDYAISLESLNAVTIISRSEAPHCVPALRVRAEGSRSINLMSGTRLSRIEQDPDRVRLSCAGPSGALDFEVDYLLLAIGRTPELSFLAPGLAATPGQQPSRDTLFFAGDVVRGTARQTAIAVGDGVAAAMHIHERIMEIGQ